VDYPIYTMVICLHGNFKLFLMFAVQYLTGRLKMKVIFVSYDLLRIIIVPAFN